MIDLNTPLGRQEMGNRVDEATENRPYILILIDPIEFDEHAITKYHTIVLGSRFVDAAHIHAQLIEIANEYKPNGVRYDE